MKKGLIVSISFLVGVAIVGVFIYGIVEIKKGLASTFDSVQTCHSLERDAQPMLDALATGKTLEGKIYACGQRLGDTLDEHNDIIYTLRGDYDPAMTTNRLLEELRASMIAAGWSAQGSGYSFAAAADRHVTAKPVVVSPKHQLYNLLVSTSRTAPYKPAGDDKTALHSIVPAADLHANYPSFALVEPTYNPEGYGAWSRHDPSAWRVGQAPNPRGFTDIINLYELRGDAAGDDSYRLYQTINEADDSTQQAKYQGLPVLGQTAGSGPVYELQRDSSLGQVRSFLVKRADSFVVLRVIGGKDIYNNNFLSIAEAIKIFDSLKLSQNQ